MKMRGTFAAVMFAALCNAANLGTGRCGTVTQDQKATDLESGALVTAITGAVTSTKGQSPTNPKDKGDIGIKKQWQKWVDANHDNIQNGNEFVNMGGAESTERTSPANAARPITNATTRTYAPGIGQGNAAGNAFKPGDIVRICIQFKEWTDEDSDGTIDEPGEVTWSDPVYLPDNRGIVVLPPLG